MAESKLPKNYVQFRSRYKKLAGALDNLGKAVRDEGPLDEKNAQLIQLASLKIVLLRSENRKRRY